MANTAAISKVWQDSPHIRERTKFLLENLDMIPTDVTFRVGPEDETEDIPAHRLILALGSPVFHTMFYGDHDLREKNDTVRIPDVDPDAFMVVVKFLYSEELLGLTIYNVMDTIYCAKKYLTLCLLERCRDFAQDNLTPDVACLVLAKADSVKEEDIATVASITINSLTSEVVSSASFLCLPEQNLRAFLTRDNLAINENAVYQAARKWVRHNTGTARTDQRKDFRENFARVVDCIRLPLMSPSQIANGPAKDRILSGDELSEVFCYKFAEEKPHIRFSAQPRQPLPRLRYVTMDFLRCDAEIGEIENAVHEITIEVRCDVAPHASKIFLDQCRKKPEFVIRYGSVAFVVDNTENFYRVSDMDLGKETFPVENHLLRNTPGMVSFCVNPGEAGARTRELQICHPNDALNGKRSDGMVFGRVVTGFDKLADVEGGLTGPIDFESVGAYFYYREVAVRARRRLPGQHGELSDDENDVEEL